MKRSLFFILLILLFVPASYCQQGTTSTVVPQLLQLKIKEGDEAKVRASRLSVSSDSTVSVGIQRLDLLNQQFGVKEMRRIFPDAGEYEEKHRKYGLHLWYEVVLDEDVDPILAASFYKAAGVIEDAEPVYRVVRINGLVPAEYDTLAHTSYQAGLPRISRSTVPNDPNLPKQWHYNNDGLVSGSIAGVDIGLFNAWDVTMGSPNIIVAVLDGGVNYTHEDLAANMWVNPAEISGNGVDDDGNGYVDDIYGYDFYGNSGIIKADNHGTHVAGTIAAVNNNSKGVAGVAGGSGGGNGIRIMSCQIFKANDDAGATTTNIKRAFIYAADNGAVICQNSWALGPQDATILEGIQYFIKEAGTNATGNPLPGTPMVGGIVIFAAGNSGSSTKAYPQAHDEVIAVAAVGPDGRLGSRINSSGVYTPYSNYGDWVDISAPGGHVSSVQSQQVYSTLGGAYGYDAGTSMACPHVSGVAALILSKYGGTTYTPDLLRKRLLASARSLKELDPTYSSQMGTGLINAYRALNWIHVTGLTLNVSSINILDGQTAQLNATIKPSNANSKELVWQSSNPECVSVDEYGNIKGNYDKGTSATITASTADGNFKATCTVTVYREEVSISQVSLKLLEKQTAKLIASIEPTNIANRQILWKSSNPGCVSVDSNGYIEALCRGEESAIITAYSDDGKIEASCNVTIYRDVVVPEGFSPNNDGMNDLFQMLLYNDEKYTLRVFDKSGQLQYENLDYRNNWDGVANKGANKGKKVFVGTYYYVLTGNNGTAKKGYIIIKY